MDDKALREHLLELLNGKSAHIDIESALEGFPVEKINTVVSGSPHTAWDLLEHIRIAQSDILAFSFDPDHDSPPWPDGYWPKAKGDAGSWRSSAAQVLADLESLRDVVRDEAHDLFAPIPHGDGQTLFREVLLAADHNAYHLGQLMLIRRMLEQQ
jgi:hypothetical protein